MEFISKFLYIFPSRRITLFFWLVLFIISSLFEGLGIGIIGPFISLAGNPKIVFDYFILKQAFEILGFQNLQFFIGFIGLLVIILFCLKTLFTWYVQSQIFKFGYLQKEKLIQVFLHTYLDAPYSLFISRNSAQIIQVITKLSDDFANSILTTFLISISNLVLIVVISIVLCIASPLTVLSLLFLLVPLILFLNAFKDKVHAWGKELHEADQSVIRGINHVIGGFKETRVIGCGPYFEEAIVQDSHRLANASVRFYIYKLSPRFIVETILVVFLVGLISISLLRGQDIQKITPILSVFALASIRLIPAFTNLVNGIGTLRRNQVTIDTLYLEIQELKEASKTFLNTALPVPQTPKVQRTDNDTNNLTPVRFSNQITLSNLTYCYPGATTTAINDVSLNLNIGQSIALIGRSGSGKTTLVDIILGLFVPQSGNIQVDGRSIYQNLRSWQDMIGYIPQSIFLMDDTIERNIAFGVPDSQIDQQRIDKAVRAAQLSEVLDNLPDGLNTRVGERGVMLSGGQRQRIGIARALYHEREILVLDEATSALDTETESLVTESIKALSGNKTMIIIAHRLTTVEYCDRIYVLEDGQIVNAGSYQEVVLNNLPASD